MEQGEILQYAYTQWPTVVALWLMVRYFMKQLEKKDTIIQQNTAKFEQTVSQVTDALAKNTETMARFEHLLNQFKIKQQ